MFLVRYELKLMYCNFVVIEGIIKNQLDKYATGCNTKSKKHRNNFTFFFFFYMYVTQFLPLVAILCCECFLLP
jgi:hypothetical protein